MVYLDLMLYHVEFHHLLLMVQVSMDVVIEILNEMESIHQHFVEPRKKVF